MTERPIIFSGAMVNAILEGRKTQTRRIVKPQPDPLGLHNHDRAPMSLQDELTGWRGCTDDTGEGREWRPYAEVGDRLWVRETHYVESAPGPGHTGFILYKATDDPAPVSKWRPSIHMPRWASRITLEVESVRVERLNEISGGDAWWEGIGYQGGIGRVVKEYPDGTKEIDEEMCRDAFKDLWQSINGPGSWEANPWVWVVGFKVIRP